MIRFRTPMIIFISIMIIFLMSLILMPTISANEMSEEDITTEIDGNPVTSRAAIVIDHLTGLVIYEFNADELRVPASMTKMLAVYVVLDAINEGLISIEAYVQPSRAVRLFSYDRYYSNVPLPVNSFFTIRELLDVVIVRSASAATIALGESIFGSEEAFVEKMNEKLIELGIEGSFFDSWGGSPENRISARGMAELTSAMIDDYPFILSFTSQKSVMFNEVEYASTNRLLYTYSGADGFKTGYTNPAGWCFTGTASVDGRRLISVTMGSVQAFRFQDSTILLNHGYDSYDRIIANHFRNTLQQQNLHKNLRSPLVPIKMYEIKESQYFDLRFIALVLNEYNYPTQA